MQLLQSSQLILQGVLELEWPFRVTQNQSKAQGGSDTLSEADPFDGGQSPVWDSVVAISR